MVKAILFCLKYSGLYGVPYTPFFIASTNMSKF